MDVNIRIHKKKGWSRLYLVLFILLSFSLFLILSFLPKEKTTETEKKEFSPLEIPDLPPPLKKNKIIIRKGATLTDILAQYNFSPGETYKLRENVKPVYDLAKIRAGHEIRIYTSQDGKAISLEYDIDEADYLHIQKKEGAFEAAIKKIPYEIRVKMIWGIIEDNLISAVTKENEQDMLALNLAELFGWDIDFYTDLRQGDAFRIIYEKKYLEGEFVDYRYILSAEFTNQGKTFQAFRYTYPDTKESDYFTFEGDSLRKEFLKSPIKYARISSRFSLRRLHPIRRVYRPHYGVDYAAKIGTPVQATADGTVTFVGWNGAAGRMIRIRHKNAYETMYLHLKRYSKGIRKGAKVKEGQVIGQVGSSGESTGPHLDYRIKYRRKYINPLAWRFKPVNPLRKEFLDDFKKKAEHYCLCFDTPLLVFSSLCF